MSAHGVKCRRAGTGLALNRIEDANSCGKPEVSIRFIEKRRSRPDWCNSSTPALSNRTVEWIAQLTSAMALTQDTRPRTVVLLQFSGIGDLVWHIVYFKAIAAQSQGGQVTVVAQPSTLVKPFLTHEPWVEEIIEHDHRPRRTEKRRGRHAGMIGMWRMASELKQGRFDRIILFSGRISRGLIAALSGIPDRRGYGYRPLQRLFLNRGPFIGAHRGNSVAAYPEASAFAVAHGFAPQWLRPTLEVPAQAKLSIEPQLAHLPRPLCALAIGTSETHKQWGVKNFTLLAEQLIARGAGVILLGGPAERELARDIQSMISATAQSALLMLTDAPVYGSAAALQMADVCVGNDTGMVNVAAAVGTSTFVLMGPRPALTHDSNMRMITGSSLGSITPEEVLTQIAPLIRLTADES